MKNSSNHRTHRGQLRYLHSVRNVSLGRNFIFTLFFAAVMLQSCAIISKSKKSQVESGTRSNPFSLRVNEEPNSRHLSENGEDWYSVSFDADGIFSLRLYSQDNEYAPFELYDKKTGLLVISDRWTMEKVKSGETYLIKVGEEDQRNTGYYFLEAEYHKIKSLEIGDAPKTLRYDDNNAWLTFTVNKKAYYDIKISRDDSNMKFAIYLLDNELEYIEEDWNNHLCMELDPGIYYVHIVSTASAAYFKSDTYTVAMSENDNLKEGRDFLETNSQRQDVVTLPSGLQYRIIKDGTGIKPTVDDKVEASYHGTLIDGTVFDSLKERGKTAEFNLSSLISGFREALTLMNEGAVWEVYIPAELGYANRSVDMHGSIIMPNSVLIFEIDLLKVIKKEEAEGKKAGFTEISLKTNIDSLSYFIGHYRGYVISEYLLEEEIKNLNYDAMLNGIQNFFEHSENEEEYEKTEMEARRFLEKYVEEIERYENEGVETSPMKTNIDSLSYFTGYLNASFYRSFLDYGIKYLNYEAIIKGTQDAFGNIGNDEENEKIKMEMRRFLDRYYKEREMRIYNAEADFLEANGQRQDVVTLPSGLQYRVIKNGTGVKPTVEDKVEVSYHGTFIDGTVFDSSKERDETVTFNVSDVIPGFSEALTLMNEGAVWEVFIPSELGYGKSGLGNLILPYSVLIFEIDLIEIIEEGEEYEAGRSIIFTVLGEDIELEISEGVDFPCIGISFGDNNLNMGFGTYMEVKKQGKYYLIEDKKYTNMNKGIEKYLKKLFTDFYEREHEKKRGKKVWKAFIKDGGLQKFIDFANEIIDDEFLNSPFNEIYG